LQQQLLIKTLRSRTWAGWIDVLFLLVVALILAALTGNAHIGSWTTNTDGVLSQQRGVSVYLPTAPLIAWIAIALLYYSGSEALAGQTIGKHLMGVKVIMIDGGALSGKAIIPRTAARVIDVLPAFYLIGWIMMRGPHRPPQRLGDRLAGTTVVPVTHP